MKGTLAFATMTLTAANVIDSVHYVAVDKNFVKVQTGWIRRNNLGHTSENFAERITWMMSQNWYLYNISKVNHADGSSTVSIHHTYYKMSAGSMFNLLYAFDNNLPVSEAK